MSSIGIGYDPAFRSDSCAGAVVIEERGVYYVAAIFERRPEKGKPLVPSVVTGEFCAFARRYGGTALATDGHYIESIREHVSAARMGLIEAPGGQQGKAVVHMAVQEPLHGGRVRIPAAQRKLIQQLREITSTPLPGGGIAIRSPRKRSGHGDLASACVLAIWHARQSQIAVAAQRRQAERNRRLEWQLAEVCLGPDVLTDEHGQKFRVHVDENGQKQLIWQPPPCKPAMPTRPLIGHVRRYVGGGQFIDRAIHEGDQIHVGETLIPLPTKKTGSDL